MLKKLLIVLLIALCMVSLPAFAASQNSDTYYWVHVPTGGAPVFIGETQGPFVKDEYPISREASAKILRVEGTNVEELERQLQQYHFQSDVVEQLVGKSNNFQWLGISGGFTLVYRTIPEPRRLKPVETEYMCLLGGEHPRVVFATNVLGQLSAEEYNQGASGLTKDPLVVLSKPYFPSPPSGMVTEFWVYANTTCFNIDKD